MKNKNDFAKLIENSSLTESDKKNWFLLINSLSEELLAQIYNLFFEYPDQINWFNDIFKRKEEAFGIKKNDDKMRALFNEIFDDEKEWLNQFQK